MKLREKLNELQYDNKYVVVDFGTYEVKDNVDKLLNKLNEELDLYEVVSVNECDYADVVIIVK